MKVSGSFVESKYALNGTMIRETFKVLEYRKGLRPLADVFWYCGGDTQVRLTLGPDWEGIGAPVMLTGHQSPPGENEPTIDHEKGTRYRRDTNQAQGMSWDAFQKNTKVEVGTRNLEVYLLSLEPYLNHG